MRGRKAKVTDEVFTDGWNPQKRLKKDDIVTIISDEPDSNNRVSVRKSGRYYPLHNVPLASLYLL